MLWTIFVLGLIVLVGMVVFGLVGGIVLALLGLAIKVLLVGAVVYFILRIVSPKTAAALRAKFGRQSLPRW